MNLSNELFNNYWDEKISEEQLIKELGINDSEFLTCLFHEIDKCIKDEDDNRLEDLVYALFVWKNNYCDEKKLYKYVNTFNLLLLSKWHTQHEDLVSIIQDIGSDTSIDFLEQAIDLNLEYLAWDENKAFEKKCVRAIYEIGQEKSLNVLQRITRNKYKVIRDIALHEIDKLDCQHFARQLF